MKEIHTKDKIEILYCVSVIILPLIFFLLLTKFFDYVLWIELIVAIFLSAGISSLLLYFARDVLSNIVPKNYQDEKGFFYKPRWKSWEFDNFVGDELLDLYEDSIKLFNDYRGTDEHLEKITDYSFLVMPIAKVYEGVLKRVLVKRYILPKKELLENPSVNVGKYFNPIGNQKIFDKLKDKARDKSVPHVIYSTYQECRNHIFHYDPYRDNRIKKIEDAEFYARRILHAIDKVYESFK